MTICKTALPKWFKDSHFHGTEQQGWLLPCYFVFERTRRRERHARCPHCGIRILTKKAVKAVKDAWRLTI